VVGNPTVPPNETGYECWLRYKAVRDPRLTAVYSSFCQHLVAPGRSDLLLAARGELVKGIGALLGRPPELHDARPGEGGYIAIGTTAHAGMAEALGGAGINPPRGDGFVLLGHRGLAVTIVGGSEQGCLYGAFALLRRLQLGLDLPARPLVEHPDLDLRMLDHWDNLDGTVERGYAGGSVFFSQGEVYLGGHRLADYARLLASVGINAIALNNVNVNVDAMALLTERHLPRVAELANILKAFGVRLFLSVGFASPIASGGLASADPLDADVREWWSRTARKVYSFVPDLGGFLVKAGSESLPGPRDYGRDHAEGANVLAAALAPLGGLVVWRCFVYDCQQDWRDRSTDRAKAAYEEFFPLDGRFAANVVLQVKAGPMDFQVREPPSPLLGRMSRTTQMLELQLTQEYTGQQVHLCYLVPAWKEVLDFRPRTSAPGEGPRVAQLVTGVAGVANIGDDQNWTGHDLAQANLYGFGRITWDTTVPAGHVASEWAGLTFGTDQTTTEVICKMLMASWPAYEAYTAPLGVGWMVTPGTHYGPSPDGYEYSRWGTYHFADFAGVGVDRTTSHGTGFTAQYDEQWRSAFDDPATCPLELLLFFHHLPYGYALPSGKTIIQHIYDSHFEGAAVAEDLLTMWRSLAGRVDVARFAAVEERLARQVLHAREWRDVINAYFYRKSGIPDEKGRPIF
jgi:alpha-glucuronidase